MMFDSTALLREYLREVLNGAGADYLKKEAVKDVIQVALLDRVRAGEIRDQQGVDSFFATVDMAAHALRMIPFAVLKAQAGPAKRPKRTNRT